MKLHELRAPQGSRKSKKRVARGHSAGGGKTAGRGTKGQKARTGGRVPPYFEGGQLPLVRRLPHKRGFYNRFKVIYAVVNVEHLARAFPAGAEVTPESLRAAGLIKSTRRPVKILGQGELDRRLTVRVHAFSQSALAKIEAAGGSAERLSAPGPA